MNHQLKLIAAGLTVLVLVTSLSAFSFGKLLVTNPPIRVACVGDSITALYPTDLLLMHGDIYTVGNFGVGGSTVSLDFRKPYMNQSAFEYAQEFAPNIVVIMLGTNDAFLSPQQRSNFTSDYKTLIATFQALPSKPKIFIVIPPPVFNNSIGLNATVMLDDVTPLIKQTANALDLPLINVYTPLVNHPEDFLDGVHPNCQGAQIIADTISNAIS